MTEKKIYEYFTKNNYNEIIAWNFNNDKDDWASELNDSRKRYPHYSHFSLVEVPSSIINSSRSSRTTPDAFDFIVENWERLLREQQQ